MCIENGADQCRAENDVGGAAEAHEGDPKEHSDARGGSEEVG